MKTATGSKPAAKRSRSSLPYLSRLRFDTGERVTRVHHAFRPIGEFLIVDRCVIRGDENDVETLNCLFGPFHRTSPRPVRMFASCPDDRQMWIIICNLSPLLPKQI